MVDILREKQRDYVADKSSAIKTSHISQNLNEMSGVVSGIKSVINSYQADTKKTEIENQKEDEALIATQFGQTAYNQARTELDNTNGFVSPEQWESIVDKYATPQRENLQTEAARIQYDTMVRGWKDKGYNLLKQQNNTTDTSRKAALSADILGQDTDSIAFKSGVRGNYSDFFDDTKDSRDSLIKYYTKQGIPEETAKMAYDLGKQKSMIAGIAERSPDSVALMLGMQEAGEEIIKTKVDNEKISRGLWGITKDFFRGKEAADANIREKVSKDMEMIGFNELKETMSDDMLNSLTKAAQESILDDTASIKREQKSVAKNSPKYKELQKRIDELESPENLDNRIASINRNLLKQSGVYEQLEGKVNSYTEELKQIPLNATIQNGKDVLSGSTNSILELEKMMGIERPMSSINGKNQTDITDTNDKKMSKIFKDSLLPYIPEQDIDSFYTNFLAYKNNLSTAKTQVEPTFVGTDGMRLALSKVNLQDGANEIQVLNRAFEAINEATSAPITQDQFELFKGLVSASVQNKVFGDIVSQVNANTSKLFPDIDDWQDITAAERIGVPSTKTIDQGVIRGVEAAGLPENRGVALTSRSNLSSVKDYVNAEATKLYDGMMGEMFRISQMPVSEQKQAANNLQNYVIAEKQRIYNNAMSNYGINLDVLDKNLNEKGYARTIINGTIYDYKGRSDNGTPLFDRFIDKPRTKNIIDRINGNLSIINEQDDDNE